MYSTRKETEIKGNLCDIFKENIGTGIVETLTKIVEIRKRIIEERKIRKNEECPLWPMCNQMSSPLDTEVLLGTLV